MQFHYYLNIIAQLWLDSSVPVLTHTLVHIWVRNLDLLIELPEETLEWIVCPLLWSTQRWIFCPHPVDPILPDVRDERNKVRVVFLVGIFLAFLKQWQHVLSSAQRNATQHAGEVLGCFTLSPLWTAAGRLSSKQRHSEKNASDANKSLAIVPN